MPRVIRARDYWADEPWEGVKVFPPGYIEKIADTEGKLISSVVLYEVDLDRHTFLIFADGSSLGFKGFTIGERGGTWNLPPLGLLVAGGLLTRTQAKTLAEPELDRRTREAQDSNRRTIERLERELAALKAEVKP
jgi:hypothetical protein